MKLDEAKSIIGKQLEFINKELYRGKRLILELLSEVDDKFIVEISDFTMKDGAIQHDWNPARIVKGVLIEGSGNPKYKEYDRDEFYKVFKIK